ncbi:MAG: hypothetical protein WCY93_11325 [Anaerolineaceae bacterium]
MRLAGIDYSMTSPSICVFDGNEWDWKSCTLHYMCKKDPIVTDQIKGSLYPEWNTDQERFDNLARWSVNILHESGVKYAFLEGYAYSAVTNRLTQIGENTGLLKFYLWKNEIPFTIFAPTAIKKFATGKGNSNKEGMYNAFLEETKVNLFQKLGHKVERKHWNPVSDMVDAFWIAKMGHMSYTNTES